MTTILNCFKPIPTIVCLLLIIVLRFVAAYVSRGGSLRDRGSNPGVVPGPLSRPGSSGGWAEPGGAWERERSFLSAGSEQSSVPSGPANHSPGLVRSSCCLRQLLHTQMTCGPGETGQHRVNPVSPDRRRTGPLGEELPLCPYLGNACL